jgi:hypothetical protein
MKKLSITRVKQSQFAATIGLVAVFAISFAPDTQGQVLTKVTVEFSMRHGDDRDHNTKTDVTIMKGTTIVANNPNVAPGEHLIDPPNGWKTYGPYDIPVHQPAIRKFEYPGSVIAVADFPDGNDTWITKVKVTAHFSDDTEIVTETRDEIKEVNQDRIEIHVP